jgi:hypothetical protein
MQTEGANKPETVSDLDVFLKSLAREGRARVSAQPLADEPEEVTSLLNQLDEQARNEQALDIPHLSAVAALWAARLFYSLCQFTVCRDIGEERIVAVCSAACPEPRRPETDWSADLVLRHLPKLFELARHLSNGDPLVRRMKRVAADWPLSSVGIPGLENLQLGSFIGHAGLRRIYADRIIAAGDSTRLGDPQVDDLLRADLGLHRELAPALANKLFNTTHEPD